MSGRALVGLVLCTVAACGGEGTALDGAVREDARVGPADAQADDATARRDAPATLDGATDASVRDGSTSDGGSPSSVCRFQLDAVPAIHEAGTFFALAGNGASVSCNSADRSLRFGMVAAGADFVPGTYRCGEGPTVGAVTMTYDGGGSSFGANTSAGTRDAPCTITIDDLSGGRARGTFSAMLERFIGTDPRDVVFITDGVLDLPTTDF